MISRVCRRWVLAVMGRVRRGGMAAAKAKERSVVYLTMGAQ
jgi:hypothetical protein